MSFKGEYQIANLEQRLPNNEVRCNLSPRNCKMKEGQLGFCGVRGNRDGRLVTYTFGKGVHLTEELIETEAIYHFAPGAKILSLGNIGCNLNCQYCQNWKTSQAKFVEDKDVHSFTPESIIETALRHNIRVLSWTYNDPVVWHEFVIATAKLAKKAGIYNLYKSACFITEEALDELLPHIDIFSVSIKAIDEAYYRKLTTGWLQPVLDATKKIYKAGKHLEVSNLMITDVSDNEQSARNMAGWVLENLGPEIPLHFVRFHPEYRMRDTVRTPIDRLERAQVIAKEMGLQHVYLGNVANTDATSSFCNFCGSKLVHRFGLAAHLESLKQDSSCGNCGKAVHFNALDLQDSLENSETTLPDNELVRHTYEWRGDITSIHVQAKNPTNKATSIYYRKQSDASELWKEIPLAAEESFRFILAKPNAEESGLEIALPDFIVSNLFEVFDRAHFPTISIEEGVSENDRTALPKFEGKQIPEKLKLSLAEPNP
ncbi:MAG: AmmeMemoRadiSam system radical SAM enzyme [Nitrospina sp.]|jgi:pyruvate formate lyase activating enzyme|nr:AmmeMemoRadiSam system radical SAM enzyme [Nitrospina sp.]MBT6717722.1 AmmeMemoRadiSam system radical SAM enzyme [Nitrospina sp.]